MNSNSQSNFFDFPRGISGENKGKLLASASWQTSPKPYKTGDIYSACLRYRTSRDPQSRPNTATPYQRRSWVPRNHGNCLPEWGERWWIILTHYGRIWVHLRPWMKKYAMSLSVQAKVLCTLRPMSERAPWAQQGAIRAFSQRRVSRKCHRTILIDWGLVIHCPF